MRQLESNKVCGRLDGSLAHAFVLVVDLLVSSRRLQIAKVGLAEEQHLVLLLAQKLVGGLIATELAKDVVGAQGIFDRSVRRGETELVQQSAESFNCCHSG